MPPAIPGGDTDGTDYLPALLRDGDTVVLPVFDTEQRINAMLQDGIAFAVYRGANFFEQFGRYFDHILLNMDCWSEAILGPDQVKHPQQAAADQLELSFVAITDEHLKFAQITTAMLGQLED